MSLTSVDLPDPDTPVTAHEHAERELDVDVLEVVLAGAAHDELLVGDRPAVLGHRDRLAAGQVLRR